MDSIGVRQLQKNAAATVERVRRGESIEVTVRGRPVAKLVPVGSILLDQLEASGRLKRGKGDLLDLGPPPKPRRGVELPSVTLAGCGCMNADRPKPVIRGLRYPVESMLDYLAAGDSIDDLLAEFPDLEREDLLACLQFAATAIRLKTLHVPSAAREAPDRRDRLGSGTS